METNHPKTIILANNKVGLEGTKILRDSGANIVAVVVHPETKAKLRDEIIEASAVPTAHVYEGDQLRNADTLEQIIELNADIAFSLFFGYILRKEFLDLIPLGVVNLHPSFLPYGKGAYPNVWAIVDQTPAGATLHYIDPGVDTGDIIAQIEVAVEPFDTGATLYEKLESASVELLKSECPSILERSNKRSPQSEGGIVRRVKDVASIDHIDLTKSYTGQELINILRARSFPPHRGAYFQDETGRRIYLRLVLEPEQNEEDQD